MKSLLNKVVILLIALIFGLSVQAQKKSKEEKKNPINSQLLSGIKFRNLGPAFMSGRIADIAVNPNNPVEWYVAVGSGGVWKTSNAGTTWNPIFDKYAVYSTGCITIDPSNENRIWLGTGENVGGRHVSIGDGAYLSEDAGKSWKNMGLKKSEHISKIIVHPSNSDIIWVASQGPLWSKGGERGLYKSLDGGKTWKESLIIDEWTGVTDLQIDPRNPDILYAASWQRHRNVAAYMAGGPGTALYKSTDGGENWRKLENGIPEKDKGKIGLAISPINPDILYAAIEFERRTGAVYRSENRGETWVKMSETVSGATGPHYYQELYADPNQLDRIVLVDVRMQVSNDGGKTFTRVKEEFKHSDNHAIVFRKGDPNYMLVGCDGGIYETFDKTLNWRYIDNLPVTQFYKLALDDTEPFYNIYGGTQDNSTQVGPSRTVNAHGITNADWQIVLGGDGHQPATEPGNPNIAYAESQQGYLFRLDRKTGERVFIQPQPGKGEMAERYNWDAPILVSPHHASHIYFASQYLYKSEDRGDSWKRISGDLTKNENRFKLPIMDQTWGWDAGWDLWAMSNYNTITSISESPLKVGLICVGTDDGRIQLTKDGGENWQLIEVNRLPNCPSTAFVNDIKFDLHQENTLYVALDNHKYGDFNPYLYKSQDLGKSWNPIINGLDSVDLVWRVVQDHLKPELLFAGTEFGLYFSINGGQEWVKFKGGLPTISFRDIAIQKRENDLVAASFGRGFFVLDDYSFMRNLSEEMLEKQAYLFDSREGLWYFQSRPIGGSKKGSQGASFYVADNPEFGVTFTYLLKEESLTKKASRQKEEKELKKNKQDLVFPEWNEIEEELREIETRFWIQILDADGMILRKLAAKNKKGIHRISWNYTKESIKPIDVPDKRTENSTGQMVAPGEYFAVLVKEKEGEYIRMTDTIQFNVTKLFEGSLASASLEEMASFWKELDEVSAEHQSIQIKMKKTLEKSKKIQMAYKKSNQTSKSLSKDIYNLIKELHALDNKLNNPKVIRELEIDYRPTISKRIGTAYACVSNSSYGPTTLARENLEIAKEEMEDLMISLERSQQKINAIELRLKGLGALEIID
ncbi:glycosyl hydrolase [Lentimicrobium sp. S6]|uniref:VPS10 domain-containing protein n=1 Tax=Lentimicrobium sp. S6 TaxID=2735872 RepID=UPI001553CD83|nr:glycosyl hydrolase [Lentimicrobium sp. S6]NPD45175.1 glycosyl hydrolase [Lentimicrobium sp. S6]